jgi:dihydroorotate dehydrogenase (fumarate)
MDPTTNLTNPINPKLEEITINTPNSNKVPEAEFPTESQQEIPVNISCWFGPNPLINASGCMCATRKMLDELKAGDPAGICTKSCTPEPRMGNPEPRYWEHEEGIMTLNSMGLPNLGVDYYLDYFKTRDNEYDGWRCMSLAVLGPLDDITQMLKKIIHPGSPVDAIEFNLSCPNLEGKEILAYDKSALKKILADLESECQFLIARAHANADELSINGHGTYTPPQFGIKLPPYWQMSDYREIAQMINPMMFSFIHTINSVPNALVIDFDREETVIHPKLGFGGLGGEIIKPIALANVRGFYLAFQELGSQWNKIRIIGCGGVSHGQDVFEMILAGADAVSVGSQLMIEGAGCINRINEELIDIMRRKGYHSIDDFRGRLKVRAADTD